MKVKTVFITISRGALVRNFFQSGMVKRLLNKGIRVVVLTPYYKDEEFWRDYVHQNLSLEPLIESDKIKFRRIINELMKGAAFNETVHSLYRYRVVGGKKPGKIIYIPRMLFLAPLSVLPYAKRIVRWLDYKINPQYEHDYLFEKYKPELVFTTTPHDYPDVGVLKSAKRFGVKTVTMPKSWDNPSIVLFNVKTDHILVWCPFVKKRIMKLQGYKENEITVTGIPQYDYYANNNNLVSREEFCRRFGFDPKKKIILYGSSGAHAGYEAAYPELIMKYIGEGRLKNTQLLVRYHIGYPKDREQYEYLEKYPGCRVDDTEKGSSKFRDYWDITGSHSSNLFNSLHHADVCITMASTLILDATACGTPVINIGFDADRNADIHHSVKRFYTRDYIKALTSFPASWLAQSEEEYLGYLKRILEGGEKKNEEDIRRFIEYFMYKNDGKSAQRIADVLTKIIND